MKQVLSLRKDSLWGFGSFGKEDEFVVRDEMQRCFQHSSWLLGFLIQYITLLMEMLLCTFCFSPSRINSSTVCMPSMHTHSYELWGEGEDTAGTCTDKITKNLEQGWELDLLPLPSDFTTRPSLLLPTGTIAHHYRQPSGVSTLGQRHLAVLKSFGRSAGTGVFCYTLWCSKEGKKAPHHFPQSS